MNSLLVFLIALLGVHGTAQAFINIEALRRSSKEGLTGSLNLQANGQSGNTEKFVGELASLNMYRSAEKEYIFLANYKYGESNNIRDTHQGSMHVRFAQSWADFPTTEAYAQSQFDQFKLLKSRDLLGAGLRFRIMEGPKGGSYLGTGVFHEWELINSPGENQEDWRANIYLSHLQELSETWQASVIFYYQPALDSMSDNRIRMELGLESTITKILSLTLKYNHQYDSAPPSTVKKHDISYMAGLSLRF